MMKILAVEPDQNDLDRLTDALRKVHGECEVLSYRDPMLAFQYAYNNPVDVVFAAADMGRLNGFTLAKMLYQACGKISVYLIGADNTFRSDARRLMLNGFLVRPVTPEGITREENAEEW